jgi:hypothetical protein
MVHEGLGCVWTFNVDFQDLMGDPDARDHIIEYVADVKHYYRIIDSCFSYTAIRIVCITAMMAILGEM